jgi:hypothetical protein
MEVGRSGKNSDGKWLGADRDWGSLQSDQWLIKKVLLVFKKALDLWLFCRGSLAGILLVSGCSNKVVAYFGCLLQYW